ncbi:MAG: type II 3-dehydroquinate dehydratase [Peptoniphilus sp.]|nr:type II 3-dehydroquinate dehydratase [Peptoniphilus sp.]
MKIIVINGPNMNMLGIREPDIYGRKTYADLINMIEEEYKDKNLDIEFYQSNHEGCIVDKIQDMYGQRDAIVINPAAYTHTSIAILDALKSVALPAVEVHLTKVEDREDFRRISYPGKYCEKTFAGLGFQGYIEAIDYLIEKYGKDHE